MYNTDRAADKANSILNSVRILADGSGVSQERHNTYTSMLAGIMNNMSLDYGVNYESRNLLQWILADIILLGRGFGLQGFQNGTPFIQKDGIYNLHKGERVVSATEGNRASTPIINITVDKPTVRSDGDIDEIVRRVSRELQSGMRRYSSY